MTQEEKIDIFLQRNARRMDRDTLIGVLADKFNMDYTDAEDIVSFYKNKKEKVMRKVKEEKSDNVITVDKEVKVGDYILEKGDKIKLL